jgi:hypothetical protein
VAYKPAADVSATAAEAEDEGIEQKTNKSNLQKK